MVINNNEGMNKFFTKVYMWMFIGLLISGGVGYYVSVTPGIRGLVYGSISWLLILELIVVILFTALRKKASPGVAKLLFVLYSAISGITLSSIFLVYTKESILTVFISAALMFGLLALYGYTTKQDLSSFGKILIFALLAIIIVSIINIFVGNSSLSIFISIISVVVFLGLTAWDMQALKHMYNYYSNDPEELDKMAIYGALDLYLDFINIFLELLRLFGKHND